MTTSVIICAAGKGERANLGKNKVLAPYNGQPVIYTACEKFFGLVDEIIVACPLCDLKEISAVCEPFSPLVVAGGETRFDSVYNALCETAADIVLIHDGARPFVDRRTIENCIECVKRNGSAVCAVPVTDTVAVCADGKIDNVPDRSGIYAVQTPQGFFTEEIFSAYKKAKEQGGIFTDDSSVYLKYIGKPHVCAGSRENIKLTYKSDFDRQYPATKAVYGNFRTGYGCDVHTFGGARNYVTLCGEKIDCGYGLIAHSDGDVAVHALMDALLSAAGLYDIGHYFPDSDHALENADSITLLQRVIALLADNGFKPVNASITIQAEKPRLAAYIDNMKKNITAALGVEADCVGISAGTCEGLGFVGNGLGIHAAATVLIEKTEVGNG